mmetsp:Transcript_52482/g.94081  ORF Transcript_52482/g.94081 Transcript_52482/m.94081 type:complete len:693 (+) Transcript_52482:43-2121(+)|eukprot:CAMPEP_0197628498 /NCGR_PEP_ID=MMETSP1338-20131121/6782_1 /TAXON_ID=43686 ORGANISM="Pelagodinium beii, Strain RCC1491" /NCGR_SAMPLE_ID=MMETSP1338 /ASSEMBLY_ACC=CAM_ASM_000754 /LENGTH=692 /DNA_ID=CAMNT_0043199481 /DNA_START=43 /DNA_END=2121 /DNA_ORIENTATION=+
MPESWTRATVWSQNGEKHLSAGGEEYALKDVLGEGGYASVYRCIRASDDSLFALKLIDPVRLGFYSGEEGIRHLEALAEREVNILRKLSGHAGIIGLEAAFRAEDSKRIFLLTEFVSGGDLFSHIVDHAVPFQETEAAYVTAQLSDALAFCHSKGIAHRDLKPENVLVKDVNVRLSETGSRWKTERLFSVKLCDFGFAKFLQGYETRTPIGLGGGTASYSAPECISDFASGSRDWFEKAPIYDPFKADAFSLGVITYVMLTQLFPEKHTQGGHRKNTLWKSFTPSVRSFIDELLCVDPSKRSSVADVCNHSWLVSLKTPYKASIWNDTVWIAPQSSESQPYLPCSIAHDIFLPALLALHRGLVLVQRERALAGYVLARAPGFEDVTVSSLDHFQLHAQLIDKQMSKAEKLLQLLQEQGQMSACKLKALLVKLQETREQVFQDADGASSTSFDEVFMAYNHVCGVLIEIVASVLQSKDSPGNAKAVRRYRLFSAAAEQLGRERAFVCGHGQKSFKEGCSIHNAADLPQEKLLRLAEIIGARKVLIGTSQTGEVQCPASGDIFTASGGIVGTLLDGTEPCLLSAKEIQELESMEEKVMDPHCRATLIREWFETLTRHVNTIHSRITINLLEDAQSPEQHRESGGDKLVKPGISSFLFGCQAGLKKLLQSIFQDCPSALSTSALGWNLSSTIMKV